LFWLVKDREEGCSKLHSEELSRVLGGEMGWTCGTYGERKNAHRVLVGKSEERDYLEN
jgi:hypothetical protein